MSIKQFYFVWVLISSKNECLYITLKNNQLTIADPAAA